MVSSPEVQQKFGFKFGQNGTHAARTIKTRVDSQGRKVGYNNGLYLNESLVKEDSWSVGKIEARTDKLVAKVMEKYPLVVSNMQ